jgi:hypothetical protein
MSSRRFSPPREEILSCTIISARVGVFLRPNRSAKSLSRGKRRRFSTCGFFSSARLLFSSHTLLIDHLACQHALFNLSKRRAGVLSPVSVPLYHSRLASLPPVPRRRHSTSLSECLLTSPPCLLLPFLAFFSLWNGADSWHHVYAVRRARAPVARRARLLCFSSCLRQSLDKEGARAWGMANYTVQRDIAVGDVCGRTFPAPGA